MLDAATPTKGWLNKLKPTTVCLYSPFLRPPNRSRHRHPITCAARPPSSLWLLSQQPTTDSTDAAGGKKGGGEEGEREILQVFSKWHSEIPSAGRFLLPAHIAPLRFCLAPCGLAGRGSQADLLLQGLGPPRPGGRGRRLFLSLPTRRERTCGQTGRAGHRHPRPAELLAASPTRPPHTQPPAGWSTIAPGRRGTYPGGRDARQQGCTQRGWPPGPGGTGGGRRRRRRSPFPLLLTAAGQCQQPARLGREAACRRLPARPGPARGAESGGGRAGGSRAHRDVCSPASYF